MLHARDLFTATQDAERGVARWRPADQPCASTATITPVADRLTRNTFVTSDADGKQRHFIVVPDAITAIGRRKPTSPAVTELDRRRRAASTLIRPATPRRTRAHRPRPSRRLRDRL